MSAAFIAWAILNDPDFAAMQQAIHRSLESAFCASFCRWMFGKHLWRVADPACMVYLASLVCELV
jgi:hypothetical protein